MKEELVEKDGGWEKVRVSATPPRELKLAWQCRQFNCLPYSGGLLEQPVGLIDKMQLAYNVWEAVKTQQTYGKDYAKFMKDHPDMHKICEMVKRQRDGK